MARVLVVDDQRLNLKMVRMTLESEGYDVIPLQDPMAMENLITKTHIDAVILDIVMPGLSGFDLIDILRSNPQTKETPIIVLTSKTEPPNRVRGLRAGANDYICKPFDPAELIARLEVQLERKVKEASALQGSLSSTPVEELFQFIAQTLKVGTIHIKDKDRSGFLQVHMGMILGARFGSFSGSEAVEALLELKEGFFSFHAEDLPPPDPDNQGVPLQELLLAHLWVIDELSSRSQFLPQTTVGLWSAKNPDPIPESMDRVPIREVVSQVMRLPGISLEGLLSRGITSPSRVRLAVAWLVEQKALLPGVASAD